MDSLKIECFLAVAELNSYSKAADMLFKNQSVLSRQVMALEEELGVRLFDRSGSRAVPTEAGRVLYEDAKNILSAHDVFANHAAELMHSGKTSLCIGIPPTLSLEIVYNALKPIEKDFPSVSFSAVDYEDRNAVADLKSGLIDMAVLRENSVQDSCFHTYPIYPDVLLLCVNENHSLASRGSVSIRELEGEDFILSKKNTPTCEIAMKACRDAGFEPRVIQNCRVESMISYVSKGKGVAMVFRRFLSIYNFSGTVCIPLTEHITANTVLASMVKRTSSLELERRVAKSLRDVFQNL